MSTRVLIVEDNPVARGFLARVVRESFTDSIEVIEASSLATARQALNGAIPSGSRLGQAASGDFAPSGFRLILCALELVDGSGLELLEQAHQDGATKIATTLYSDDDHLFPALQLGADGYLLKEDRFEVLVEELQRIVRGQPTMSPAIARRISSFFREHSPACTNSGQGQATPGALTNRDIDLLSHVAKGFTFKEIARTMGMRLNLINEQILSIYRKLAISSVGLVATVVDDRDG